MITNSRTIQFKGSYGSVHNNAQLAEGERKEYARVTESDSEISSIKKCT